MTIAVKKQPIAVHLQNARQRIQTKHPVKNIDNTESIYTSPSLKNKSLKQSIFSKKFANIFDIIRQNFKNYITKTAYHLNSQNIIESLEQQHIDNLYKKDEKLQHLMKCLDIALEDFAKNTVRFMPNTKNTDYKLDIFIGGKNNTNVRIVFKNAQEKQIGPFLSTHITTSPTDKYDMLTVNIGYIDKHKKTVLTHSFGFDMLEDVNIITEQRGDTTNLKTNEQIYHDKFKDTIMQTKKQQFIKKKNSFEI